MPIVTCQSFLLNILDQLPLPYGLPAAGAFITPPDPYVRARIPAIYIWPSEGEENRSVELGGTVPRNSGFNTPSGTKGMMHQFDVYITWTGAQNQGSQTDPYFPGIIDAVMAALRYSQPNPATRNHSEASFVRWRPFRTHRRSEDCEYAEGHRPRPGSGSSEAGYLFIHDFL